MASINKAIIIGNLGADPELRQTQSGTAVCQLSVATNEQWKDQSGTPQERTEWHRVVVFGRQAENVAKYLSKGRSVYVEGRIQTRGWTGDDGQKRYTTEIVAQTVQFLSGGGGSSGGGGGYSEPPPPSDDYAAGSTGGSGGGSGFGDDDIPF